ncbi:hypothetical protein PG994_007077, partial [Apiospora phragmitis]
HTLLTLEYVVLSLALLAVVIRLYVRATKIGFGRHIWDITVSILLGKSYLFSVNGIMYPLTMLFAKLPILLLCIRIFNINRAVRIMIFVSITILTLFYLAIACIAIGSIVICNGLNANSIGFCRDYSGQLPLKRKLGALAVFAAGFALTRLVEFCIHYGSSYTLWIQAINAQLTFVISFGMMCYVGDTLLMTPPQDRPDGHCHNCPLRILLPILLQAQESLCTVDYVIPSQASGPAEGLPSFPEAPINGFPRVAFQETQQRGHH